MKWSSSGPARVYPTLTSNPRSKETAVLLIVAIVLLVIAIAGGAIVHPLLFALAIVALVMFFAGR